MRNEINFDTYHSIFDGGARNTHFFVKFGIPPIVSPADVYLTYYVKSTEIPVATIESHTINHGIYEHKIPSNVIYNEWSVAINVDRKNTIISLFYDWQEKILKNIYPPVSYMSDQKLYLMDNNGNVSSTYNIKYAWLKSISDGTLSYENSEVLSIKVDFSYLYYEWELGGSLNA